MLEPCNSDSSYDDVAKKLYLKNRASKLRNHSNFIAIHGGKNIRQTKEASTQSDGLITEQDSPPNKEADEKAKRETFRLASFRKCKIAVPPFDLAMAGFYYVGPGDRVRCFSCGNYVQSWRPKDDVFSERWHSPDCRHFHKKGSGNISISDASRPPLTTIVSTPSTSAQHAVETSKFSHSGIEPPTYSSVTNRGVSKSPLPEAGNDVTIPMSVDAKPQPPPLQQPQVAVVFSSSHQALLGQLNLNREVDRRSSFAVPQWPQNLIPLIGPLARTGFFYLGNSDRAQCFSCGAVQKNWLATDDVRRIHAEMFVNCRMVHNAEKKNIPFVEQPFVVSSPQHRLVPRQESSYLSPVPVPDNIPGNYFTPSSSPRSSTAQSLDLSDPQIRGPPIQRPVDKAEISYSRQISSRSTDTVSTANSLGGVFETPPFSTGPNGELSVNLPAKSPEYTDIYRSKSTPNGSTSPLKTPVYRDVSSNRFAPVKAASGTGIFSLPTPTTSSYDSGNTVRLSHTSAPSITQSHSVTIPESSSASASANMSVTPRYPSQPSLTTAASSENNHFVTSSRSEMTAFLPILAPSKVTSGSSTPFNPTEEATTSRIALQESTVSSSSQNWLRELDPFAAVAGTSELEPIPDLPQSELDVDENFVEDDKMRMMLKELYPCQEPANRSMVYFGLRLASFRQPWPEDRSLSAIPDVAKAGFYYLGTNDHVCCWYCGTEAENWACDQRAWDAHALLYPSCQYLLRNRGLGFVETVLSQVSEEEPHGIVSEHSSSVTSLVPSYPSSPFPSFSGVVESGPERLPTPPILDPREEYEQQKIELHQAMQTEMANRVMAMGFSHNHVRQVMKKQIEEFSCAFQTSEALVDALILTPEDLIDFNSDEESNHENQPEATNRQVGVLEELPDNLDLYQSGEPASLERADDDYGVVVGRIDMAPGEFLGHNRRDDITGPEDVIVHRSSDVTSAELNHESATLSSELVPATEVSNARDEELPANEEDLQAELRRLRQEKRCKICLDRDACMVFIPCGHMCACMDCTHRLKQCPLCRRKIDKAYKTY